MMRRLIILCLFLSSSLFQATDIFKAIESNNKKEIQKWLKSNPSVDLLNDQEQSVLIAAVCAENNYLVKQLLKRKAVVNVIDKWGKTALDYAVKYHNNGIVLRLVKHDAQVTSQKNLGKVKEILRHRARVCIALSLGLIVFAGLIIQAAVITGMFLAAVCISIMLCTCCPFFIFFVPLLFVSIAFESFFSCLIAGVIIASPFVVGSIYSAVSCGRWYRRANKMQLLTIV